MSESPTAAELERLGVYDPSAPDGAVRLRLANRAFEFTIEAYLPFLGRLPAPPEPSRKVDVTGIFGDAGFVEIERAEETVAFVFPDEHAWWDWAWTTGSGRRNLEPHGCSCWLFAG